MVIRLDKASRSLIQKQLLSNEGGQLVEYMYRKSVGLDCSDISKNAKSAAQTLGWVSYDKMTLTALGGFVADSCREFKFWNDRDRHLPFEKNAGYLNRQFFSGKTVVEIGCGMGANLMSLQGFADKVIGIEPIELYVQMGGLLRDNEQLQQLDIRIGEVEKIPLEQNACDVVLCVTAHQYFDIVPALREISRILRSGGELIIIGGTFTSYLKGALFNNSNSLRSLKAMIMTLLNSLSYMTVQKRILPARTEASTTRPVYPTRRAMRRWLSDADFSVPPNDLSIGRDTGFCARKQPP